MHLLEAIQAILILKLVISLFLYQILHLIHYCLFLPRYGFPHFFCIEIEFLKEGTADEFS